MTNFAQFVIVVSKQFCQNDDLKVARKSDQFQNCQTRQLIFSARPASLRIWGTVWEKPKKSLTKILAIPVTLSFHEASL